MNNINVFTDGGARGNPGPAASGVYIEEETGKEIASFGVYIGNTTNNVAEYTAVIEALRWLLKHKEKIITEDISINFFLDSQLVVFQLNGLYKVKNELLHSLFKKIRELELQIQKSIRYSHIPREQNKKADREVNRALDNRK